MAEYIEREAVVYALEHDAPEQAFYSRDDAVDCIRALSTVDVMPVCKGELEDLLEELARERIEDSDDAETYITGYRIGHRNGQIELLRWLLGKPDGTREEVKE